MQTSLSEPMKLIAPLLSEALVSPTALAHIQQLAEQLPFTMQVAFEARLAEGNQQVDVAQLFTQENGLRELLATYVRQMSHDKLQTYSLIGDFAEEWASVASVLHNAVSLAWLEYDLPENIATVLVPGVFIALPNKAAHAESRLHVMKTVLNLLGRDQSSLDGIFTQLKACLQMLPPSAVAITLGVMPSRQLQGIRLPIHHMKKQEIIPYLGAIGWHGDADCVAEMLEQYFDLSDHIAIDLDIGAEVFPQLGLELHLKAQPPTESRWQQLLNQLVSENRCAPAKRDALLAWPGIQPLVREIVHWPEYMLMQTLIREGIWVLARGLSHIKMVYKPGVPVSAKAYFGYMIEWVDRKQAKNE